MINTPTDTEIKILDDAASNNVKPIAIVYHDECALHSIPKHPERSERYTSILKKLRDYLSIKDVSAFFEAPLATENQIIEFHTVEHWKYLTSLFEIADTKYLEYKNSNAKSKNQRDLIVPIDGDTKLTYASKNAILRAAGAACYAVDLVLGEPKIANAAFCCIRPPGHHAERNRSMGFCFLNNAGIAAKYSQSKYNIGKVAVLDFDVHHGNGTEEGFTEFDNLFYGSTHEKDNYPGTGMEPERTGELAVDPLHRRIVNRYLPSGTNSGKVFRIKWREIVEEMILFQPEFIIFSAGFDAHKDDPLGGCKLLEEDFEWATRIVYDAAMVINPVKPPPMISVLEGGYNVFAISNSALIHVKAMEKGYPAAPLPGDEIAVLERQMDSLGINDIKQDEESSNI